MIRGTGRSRVVNSVRRGMCGLLAGGCVLASQVARAEGSAPWWMLPGLKWPIARDYLLFASLETGPGQHFVSGGFKWALSGSLEESGLRAFVKAGGAERRRDGPFPIPSEIKGESQALIGGEMMTGRGAIGLFLGYETASSWTGRARRFGLPPEQRTGLRIQADVWDHPRPELLVHASAAASSATEQGWGRLALGYRLLETTFVGPEIDLTGASHYIKRRFGAHLSGLKLLGLEWRISAGHERASHRSRGLYATLSVQWRR